MIFDQIGFSPTEILLPAKNVSRETWACEACDQYTSEPEYWEKANKTVGSNPSALRMILPECYLNEKEKRIPLIHQTMKDYLKQKILIPTVHHGFVLCERKIATGTRVGLIGAVDLEAYSFEKNSHSLIRPTEQTIASRLPARQEIREGAPVELSHIMILIDDPNHTVLEPLRSQKNKMTKLYDFDLMLNGGHLAGYEVSSNVLLDHVSSSLEALCNQAGPNPLLFAVGDGNHSLATAKACWEKIRSGLRPDQRQNHPARYALAEIVNIHDEALLFEPIHRVLYGTSMDHLMKEWASYAKAHGMSLDHSGTGHSFRVISKKAEELISVLHPEGAIPCETLQKFLDDYILHHDEVKIDYIHGDQSLRSLASKQDTVGILLPEINKNSFFKDVQTLGVLPRKTFSMGEADEKRFYMEAKKI